MPASRCSVSDIAALIGTPWQAGAVGPDAYDCWSGAGMVQERFFGRSLPGLGPDRRKSISGARMAWRRAGRPRDGDLIEMRRMGRANHVGVWIGGCVLHCQRGAGFVYDRPDAIRLMGWQMRVWTPAPAARPSRRARAPRALYVPGIDLLMSGDTSPEELIDAHRTVPIEARTGETVAQVIARAGLGSDCIAVFLREADDNSAIDWPEGDDPQAAEAVLRALGAVRPERWAETRIGRGQRLVITQVPQDGGGSNPLRLVLQIAIIAASAFAGGLLAPGLVSAFGFASEAAAGAFAFGALNIAGNLILNAILPPPSPRGLTGFAEVVSPTFSARAQSSIARPGAPIPIQFGRHIHQLDDVSPPFVRFENNTQIVYQLLALGIGQHLLEEVRLGETTVWRDGALTGNLPGVSVEHILAGQPVTLMDEAVFTQGDVSGLTLAPDEVLGWHSAVPPGRKAVAVEIDIAFQQLVTIDNQGGNQNRTVELLVEAQMIDDDDTPLGHEIVLDTLSFTGATRSALRSSHRWFVTDGRWRVRITRQTPEGDDQTFDDAIWAGLKGILPGGRTWAGLELLAVRVEVGEAFAAQSARQVSGVKTRKLPVWNGAEWSAPQPTREIAWAVAEMARMHGRLDDLDMDDLLALHATWSARGDRFDTIMDQRLSLWEALQGALRAGRAQPDQLGRAIRIWRDAPQPIPRQLFSEHNIRRGSLTIRPRLPVSERPERLVAEFMDERTWRPAEIAVGAISGRERRERYFGMTNREHILREVGHDFRASRYRSVEVSFEVELENRLLRRGDPIALSHRELTGGVSVRIEEWSGLTLRLGRAVGPFEAGVPLLMSLAAPDGGVLGPFAITPAVPDAPFETVSVTQAEMDRLIADHGADPRDRIARSPARDEAIRAIIGPGAELQMRLIVQEVAEERGGFAAITGVDDDPRAHDVAVDPTGSLEGLISVLAFKTEGGQGDALLVKVRGDLTSVSGDPDNPVSFIYETSTDGGLLWQTQSQTGPNLFLPWPSGLTDIRAAIRVGDVRGPWVVVQAPGTGILPAPTGFAEVAPGTFALGRIHVAANPVADASSYRFELLDGNLDLMAVLFRAAPGLDLDAAALAALGALSRETDISLMAVDGNGRNGAAATLALPVPPPPGVATDVLVNAGRFMTWQATAPIPTRWRIEWPNGSHETETAEFDRFLSGWANTLQIFGLDAFGPGAPLALDFTPPGGGGDQ
jgi:hypothetical protein